MTAIEWNGTCIELITAPSTVSFSFLFGYSVERHMNPRNNSNISNDNTTLFQTKLLIFICSSNKATLGSNKKKYILNIFVMCNISGYEKCRSQGQFSMSWGFLEFWLFLFPTILMSNSWKVHARLFIHLFSCRWNNLTSTHDSEKKIPTPWQYHSLLLGSLVLSNLPSRTPSSLPISCWFGLVTGTNVQQNMMAQAGMGT